ncbi:PadR family transcriptional regulator [Microbacterium sp. 1.5R]|uniref:PadR family transcriptional regulator n=1 Tax=Microbacterium sp. 1.5R TaxID=1916917 RepID=UPI00119D40FC|nr:PadR family transcriptional regulator [Microbacterium sp. 1.5R]
MSVRQSLLAILAQGPCYGYQLRHEFVRRTGSVWPLNVGQIYNTLERLERDGLVRRDGADAQGHVYWEITSPGLAEVDLWLSRAVERTLAPRDEVAIKIALAATLPGADAAAVIDEERAAAEGRLAELRMMRASRDEAGPEGLAHSLVLDSLIFSAEAESQWLEHARTRLGEHPDHGLALALDVDRPKRGRPARAGSAALV